MGPKTIKVRALPESMISAVTAWAKWTQVRGGVITIGRAVLCHMGSIQQFTKQGLVRDRKGTYPFLGVAGISIFESSETWSVICMSGNNSGPLQSDSVVNLSS